MLATMSRLLASNVWCRGAAATAAANISTPLSRTLAVAHASSRPKSRRGGRQDAENSSSLDSTNELLLDSVAAKQSSGAQGDANTLDLASTLDELLQDDEAMKALRSMLKAEMQLASGSTAAGVNNNASGSSGSSSSSGGKSRQQQLKQQAGGRQQGRAFDSDEYDASALESVYEYATSTSTSSESYDFAQAAANNLVSASREIAEHIIHEHEGDGLIDAASFGPSSSSSAAAAAGTRGSKGKNRSSSSEVDGNFKLKLPAFAAAGGGAGGQKGGKQQKQSGSCGSTSSTAAGDNSGGRGSKGSSSAGAGGSSGGSSSGGDSGGSKPSSAATGPRRLSSDSAIGRVAASRGGVPVVVLKQGKARLFQQLGSPMVYGGAVECVVGRPQPVAGDVVAVCDNRMQSIGWGVFNPVSMFRVRLLQSESEALAADDDSLVLDVEQLLDLRIQQAVALRSTLGLPSPSTNAYRLVNSEGDRLSGLTADVLGDVVVVQSCAAWTERYREGITRLLLQHTSCSRVVWRPAVGILKEEGIDLESSSSSREQAAAAAAGGDADVSPLSSVAEGDSSSGSSPSGGDVGETVEVVEAGLTFLATPEAGQKTGFYADQRQNRAFIASLSAGKTVLDLCCYSGGFALMAAAAGAAAVTGVDSSASAVQLAQDNAELNGLTDRCAFVRDDVSTFLRAALEAGESWDVVVLDPPKLAPNRPSLPRASAKYRRLNELALGVVKSGGVLMTCSCSGAMTQSGGLGKVVQEAATAAERQVTLLAKSGAAPDHPLNPGYAEGEYLTALAYRVV